MSKACTVSSAIKDTTVLGKTTEYIDHYNPALLDPIPRALGRAALPNIQFIGYDLWRLYEITWLNKNGIPQVAFGTLKVPASSDFIVESKSLKLYVGSLTQSVFESKDAVQETIIKDLSAALQCDVDVQLYDLNHAIPLSMQTTVPNGLCLEQSVSSDFTCSVYDVTASLIALNDDECVEETVYSNLLRSRCPVTGQPDHATVSITYKGKKLVHEQLLAYLISYRNHQGFHEQCAEQIYSDLMQAGHFEKLTVSCSFTRRGGIDISPVRSNQENFLTQPLRTPRQ